MALLGFEDDRYPRALLRTRARVTWEVSSLDRSDALWVEGKTARLEGEFLRIRPEPKSPTTILHLRTLDRPLTVAKPLDDAALATMHTVDLRTPASVDLALRRTEQVLHPLLLQLAMAAELAERMSQLQARSYHLIARGKLVAMVTMGGEIGLDLSSSTQDLAEAKWTALPARRSDIPGWFLPTSFAECLWLYVGRTETDLLPRRYRRQTLYFRALPQVPQRLIGNTHYAVLAELGALPQTFEELQQTIGLGEQELADVLAALYYAGSVTTSPERAARGAPAVQESVSASELRNSMFPSQQASSQLPSQLPPPGATMPAPLLELRMR